MFFYLLKSIPIVTYEIYLFTKVNADFYFVFGLYSSSFSLAYGSCFAISLSRSRSALLFSSSHSIHFTSDPRLFNVGFSSTLRRAKCWRCSVFVLLSEWRRYCILLPHVLLYNRRFFFSSPLMANESSAQVEKNIENLPQKKSLWPILFAALDGFRC